MNFSKFKKNFSILLLIFIPLNICSAVPLDSREVNETQQQWKIISAKNALDVGLFHLAEQLYREVLKQETDPTAQQEIGLQLASSLINESKNFEAIEVLDELPRRNAPEARLLLAIASIRSNPKLSKELLEQGNLKDLPSSYRPWFYVARGLVAESTNNLKDARSAFMEARALATSETLKLHIDILLFRLDIFSGKSSESLEKSLAKKIAKEKNIGTIKQYAIVLDEQGKKAEALELLESSLESLSLAEKDESDPIMLLIALIAGPESEKGRFYLEKIIEKKHNLELAKAALSMLAGYINTTNAQSYFGFLTKVIDSPQSHPLMDVLLIQRAQLGLFLGQNEVAQADATRLLEEYPGSIHNSKALRILAYIAWSSTPPRYRTAADILSNLLEGAKDDNERAEINTLIADSYFLNHDYANAARLYTTLLKDTTHTLPKGPFLYQLTLCAINQNSISAAERILDKFDNDSSIDPVNLWRAEWNLINFMKKRGRIGMAFARIQKLLNTTPSSPVSTDLKLRLLWLKAELSFESKNPQDTPLIIDSLLDLLKSSEIDSEQKSIIASQALLLKSQALFELKKEESALEAIEKLRITYPDSKAAILSYIIEARYYTSINNSIKAQQQLINLSDSYPESEYAAISLYEAALNTEARGLKNTYQEALAILERLTSAYPDSPLAYHARFKQGDILRKLGDFSNAQLIYETLIKQNPDNLEKPRAELALIDCLFAQAIETHAPLTAVATQYAHLFDLPQLPASLRAEAGFKSGFALLKASQAERAQESLWQTITTLLVDANVNKQLNDQGRYWIARSIFELGALLEKTGNIKEANQVYQLIAAYNLPGSTLANSKIK